MKRFEFMFLLITFALFFEACAVSNASNSTMNLKLDTLLKKAAQENWRITVLASHLKESNKGFETEYSFVIEQDLLKIHRDNNNYGQTIYLPLSKLSWIQEEPLNKKLNIVF